MVLLFFTSVRYKLWLLVLISCVWLLVEGFRRFLILPSLISWTTRLKGFEVRSCYAARDVKLLVFLGIKRSKSVFYLPLARGFAWLLVLGVLAINILLDWFQSMKLLFGTNLHWVPRLSWLFDTLFRFLQLWSKLLQGDWEELLFIAQRSSLLAFGRLLSARRVGWVELLFKDVDYLLVLTKYLVCFVLESSL